MSFYLLVRFLHIATAIWFIGGLVARQIVRSHAKRTDDIHRFAAFREAAERVERTMVMPGSVAVVVVGIFLGFITGAPILGVLQGAPKNWLLVSNLLILMAFLFVPLIFLPWRKKYNLALTDALAKGQITPELRAHVDDVTVRLAHWFELGSTILVVFLMVFKPF
ncbi:MAG: DUF2269 family protein [Chloroflexota bacterium]